MAGASYVTSLVRPRDLQHRVAAAARNVGIGTAPVDKDVVDSWDTVFVARDLPRDALQDAPDAPAGLPSAVSTPTPTGSIVAKLKICTALPTRAP